MTSSWESLITSTSLSIFKDEEGQNERRFSPNVEVKEEPLTNYSTWSELKEATLNDDELENEANTDSQEIYGCNPLKDESGTLKCNECSKKLSPQSFIEHTETCEKIRENSLAATVKMPVQEASANKNAKNNNASTAETCNSNKKRKRSVNSEGPIDLDKQCGVIAPPSTTPCTRSLTCKSHPMALKRAVQGRSQLYDILLAQYQKKSIGRPQNNGVANKQENGKKDGKNEVSEKDDGPIDSEQEVDSVMEALMCSKPRPITTRQDTYAPPTSNYFLYSDVI